MQLSRVAASALALLLVAPTASAAPKRISKKVKKLPANCFAPRWSSDGTKLSYEFHMPGDNEEKGIYIVSGKKQEKVEPDTGADAGGFDESGPPPVREMTWHPKGVGYVYGSTGGRSQINLYMEGEGCLTCEKAFGYGNKIHPTWAANGKLLAFALQDPSTEHGEIYMLDIYNLEKGPKKMTEHEDDTSYQPRFSPDSKRLLFTRFNPEKSDNNLYVIDNLDKPKESLRQLTKMKGAELNASWSPDGARVAFFSITARKGKKTTSVYVINADGTSPKKLFKKAIKPDLSNPVWTPDGSKLLVVRDNERKKNPIMWVSSTDAKQSGLIKTGTELNDYIAVYKNGDSLEMIWTAQGKSTDKKKRWKKVYRDSITLP